MFNFLSSFKWVRILIINRVCNSDPWALNSVWPLARFYLACVFSTVKNKQFDRYVLHFYHNLHVHVSFTVIGIISCIQFKVFSKTYPFFSCIKLLFWIGK